MSKTKFLQVRMTPEQKETLARRAERAGEDLSTFVLRRVLPREEERVDQLLVALCRDEDRGFALAELNDLLWSLSPARLAEVTEAMDVRPLGLFAANYVAAMVEQACHMRNIEAPAWTTRPEPLEAPYFATELPSLRLHLLRNAPVPFKRRNIYIDATVGDRV